MRLYLVTISLYSPAEISDEIDLEHTDYNDSLFISIKNDGYSIIYGTDCEKMFIDIEHIGGDSRYNKVRTFVIQSMREKKLKNIGIWNILLIFVKNKIMKNLTIAAICYLLMALILVMFWEECNDKNITSHPLIFISMLCLTFVGAYNLGITILKK